ncbi:NAD(P)H-quinone oxidoreductase subunit H [Ignicoccus pacificus DSM 13166]|uniref:NAD(P)H-quinone oxidoreductase subunit H n=1 Tax=Ignicoccus pacificus DSM 13166 TaxID=940294 RepID=A0A977KA48_9CREN|nr:NAD(P)H-quinone oxidoreductase subunit H [Ignicoccus pacificus DSM 13166]
MKFVGELERKEWSNLTYVEVEPNTWYENASRLLDSGYLYPQMLTAIDWPAEKKIQVLFVTHRFKDSHTVAMSTKIDRENRELPTLTDLYPGIEWQENEAYEMFGIDFVGHPDYKRWGRIRKILLSEDPRLFPKDRYPLLKDSGGYKNLPKVNWNEIEGTDREKEGLRDDLVYVYVGPQHPATHGPVGFLLGLRGEIVEDVIPRLGYVHRGVEWIFEQKEYSKIIPLLDRQCYVDGIGWEIPYVLAVEEIMNVKVDERANLLRILAAELSRIQSHILYIGSFLENINHLTGFAWTVRDREVFINLLEMLTGQRMTFNYLRIGGVARDLPQGFRDLTEKVIAKFDKHLDKLIDISLVNPTVAIRADGVAPVSAEDAIKYGWTGPNLRASGVAWDYRINKPYMGYDSVDFEGAIGNKGDILDRMLVRFEEIRQSLNIVRQVLKSLTTRGDLGKHYKRAPPFPRQSGIAYGIHESARGENGVLVVANPKDPRARMKPWRVHMRSPVFIHTMSLKYLGRGLLLQDFLANYISLDTCVAEMDR